MYLIKNAFINITRNKGRNILIGIIITIITICTCIALSINLASNNLVDSYIKTNPLEISFNVDMNSLREATDDEKNNFQSLTVDDIKNYGDSEYVKDFYYTLSSNLSSNDISAIEDLKRPDNNSDEAPPNDDGRENRNQDMQSLMGDYTIIAYSNFAYLSDFSSGDKKITSGVMVSGDSEEDEIVISEALASQNDLEVGSEITFYLPSNEDITFTFKVVGIYEDNTEDNSSSNIMSINALMGSNQIYANLSSVTEILDNVGEDSTRLIQNNGLSAKYYLYDNEEIDAFTDEVKSKGLSDYYNVQTNEEEVLASLEPIQNISSFSINFLIIILIIGIVVLTVINLLNIRDRKYEIGVLRAIGMSKLKVMVQLTLEILMIALASLIIGTTIGALSSQAVTNKMLESEITSYQNDVQNIENNFGGKGFDRPSNDVGNNKMDKPGMNENVDYVTTLQVKLSILTIFELFLIVLLLTASSSIVAITFINKYNPNKILQNRN